ncbi:MAG: hypothetical protein ACE37J_02665 [Pikeienuella sp.]|uniref:hypothetical protein n=1 Tax=Pikeienuella sp. TaxID=2831957 RepID=UPI00391B0F27
MRQADHHARFLDTGRLNMENGNAEGPLRLDPAELDSRRPSGTRAYLSFNEVSRPGYDVCVVVYKQDTNELVLHGKDGVFAEVLVENVAEHLATDRASAAAFWRELYRICAHGAIVKLLLRARPIGAASAFPNSLGEMREAIERVWTLDMDVDACFAVEQGVSFGLLSYEPIFSAEYHRAIKRRKMTQDAALAIAEKEGGVVDFHYFSLIVNKRLSAFEEVEL